MKTSRIISITNQKGGVGKTTTTANLSVALGTFNKKVLIIDLDPQGNLTFGFNKKDEASEKDIYNALSRSKNIRECVIKNIARNVDLIPSTLNLSAFNFEQARDNKAYENPFNALVQVFTKEYDYILIDCPPSLGLLNRNALASSNSVIIPIQAEFYALDGLTQLSKTMREVQQRMGNPNLEIEGVLVTMFDNRLNMSKEVMSYIRNFFADKLFTTVIPRNVSLSEAPSHGLSAIEYKRHSKGSISYINLAEELIERRGS